MQDFLYPLPKKDFLRRFKPVFDYLNSGLSVVLSSPPYTGKSSLIKFILSQPTFLQNFTQNKVLYFTPDEKLDRTQDEYLEIKKSLDEISQVLDKRPLIVVIDHLQSWDSNSQTKLKLIWELGKRNFPHKINFLLLNSSPDLSQINIRSSIKEVFTEKEIVFNLWSESEIEYATRRFLSLYKDSVSELRIKDIVKISSGVAGLIRPLIKFDNTYKKLDPARIAANREIHDILLELLPFSDIFPKTSFISVSLQNLHPSQRIGDLEISSDLSAQDMELLNKFLSKPNEIINRDEIAETIWGKLSAEKYSDWAIDKAISRLKSKFPSNSRTKILTIRNAGYKLISL